LTSALSFAELSRNFRENIRIFLSADPSYQQGAHQMKSRHHGPWGVGGWLSQSLTFGSLAAEFGACFLRLQNATLGSTSGRSTGVIQDHGIWLW